MITDEERRRVARRMYDAADGTVFKGNSFCAMLARMTRAKEATRRSVMHRLAGLIDRPTCKDVTDFDRESFKCSRCGYRVLSIDGASDAAKLVAPGGGVIDFGYCPNCGAEVVEE